MAVMIRDAFAYAYYFTAPRVTGRGGRRSRS